jgi:hypothetical protein
MQLKIYAQNELVAYVKNVRSILHTLSCLIPTISPVPLPFGRVGVIFMYEITKLGSNAILPDSNIAGE